MTAISCYVPELSDTLLSLFPHRYDYLWAEHTRPGDTPQWKTENRLPFGGIVAADGYKLICSYSG